jgi:hypothetical protein
MQHSRSLSKFSNGKSSDGGSWAVSAKQLLGPVVTKGS